MYDYDPEAWVQMIERTMTNHAKHLESVDFWVETKELYDKQGQTYSQMFPRFAVNFK